MEAHLQAAQLVFLNPERQAAAIDIDVVSVLAYGLADESLHLRNGSLSLPSRFGHACVFVACSPFAGKGDVGIGRAVVVGSDVDGGHGRAILSRVVELQLQRCAGQCLPPVSRPSRKGHYGHMGRVSRAVEGTVGVGVDENLAGIGALASVQVDKLGLAPMVLFREWTHVHPLFAVGHYGLALGIGGEHAMHGGFYRHGVHLSVVDVVYSRVHYGNVHIVVGFGGVCHHVGHVRVVVSLLH